MEYVTCEGDQGWGERIGRGENDMEPKNSRCVEAYSDMVRRQSLRENVMKFDLFERI